MAKILSFKHTPKVEKENVIKSLWESFLGLDLFIKMMIIAFLLIAIATPAIVFNYQIFRPFAQAGRTAQTIASGNWFDPSVWSGGLIPIAGDSVVISPNHTIIYNVLSDDVLGEIKIQGILKFSRTVNTRLKVNDNIMVEMGGYLDMGTPQDFIPKNIKSEIIFVLTQAQASAYVGGPMFQPTDKGLWVMDGGRWESHGAPLGRAWSKLAEDAPVGATSVTVENNVADWYVGGTVVMSSTDFSRKSRDVTNPLFSSPNFQDELRTITGIALLPDARTRLTLDKALTFAHSGTAPMRGEVGLLTRNILIKTELVGVSNTEVEKSPRKRLFAHTMYMHGSKGNISYTEFKYMGYDSLLGRYTVHPHKMLDTSRGMILRGNGLWYTGNRWINIHSSNGILIEDNVGYQSANTGYYIEWDFTFRPGDTHNPLIVPGTNLDLIFIHNLGVRVEHPNPNGGSFAGQFADVFYLDGDKSTVVMGNVASGGGERSNTAGFQTTGGFRSFLNNEAHSNYSFGLRHYVNNNSPNDSVGLNSWGNAAGFGPGSYTGFFPMFQSNFIDNFKGAPLGTINYFFQDSLFKDNHRVGFEAGAYVAGTDPRTPNSLFRNIFRNNGTADISQNHAPCPSGDDTRPVVTGGCGGTYLKFVGNTFQSNKSFDFGWSPNANTHWKVFGYPAQGNIPKDFVILRNDQLDLTKQTDLTKRLVTAQSFYSPDFDAVVTPMSSLPATIEFIGLKNEDGSLFNFTFTTTQPDFPPQATLAVTTSGTQATMNADVTDDKGVTKVEFWVDENKVAEKTSPPFTHTVDLSNHGRKYAYLYVKAYDGQVLRSDPDPRLNFLQRAYSKVTELGPEVILAGGVPLPSPTGVVPTPIALTTVVPTPIPTSTPIPTPTSIPTPILRPTSTPIPPLPTQAPTPTIGVGGLPIPTVIPIPTPQPIACAILSSSWVAPFSVIEGTTVNLSLTTNNAPLCSGKKIVLEIKENGFFPITVDRQPEPIAITNGSVSTSWIAEFHPNFLRLGSPAYFFNANIEGEGQTVRSDDPMLTITKAESLAIANTPKVIAEQTRATISWETNKLSSSEVRYGLKKTYSKTTSESDAIVRLLSHSVPVVNLRDCVLYHYKVASRDTKGELAETTTDFNFVTKGCNASVVATSETDLITDRLTGDMLKLVDNDLEGLTLSVPSNFSLSNSHFQILKLNKQEFLSSIPPPLGLKEVGDHIYHLNSFLSDEDTKLSSFDKEVTIKIKYDPSDIQGVDEATLSIHKFKDGTWTKLDNCVTNTVEKLVVCTTPTFSDFALFGNELIPTPTLPVYATPYGSPSTGGGGGYGTPGYGTPSTGGTGKRGDLNNDGRVNIFDLSILLRSWSRGGTGDLNTDGKVNIFDLSIMLRNWGR